MKHRARDTRSRVHAGAPSGRRFASMPLQWLSGSNGWWGTGLSLMWARMLRFLIYLYYLGQPMSIWKWMTIYEFMILLWMMTEAGRLIISLVSLVASLLIRSLLSRFLFIGVGIWGCGGGHVVPRSKWGISSSWAKQSLIGGLRLLGSGEWQLIPGSGSFSRKWFGTGLRCICSSKIGAWRFQLITWSTKWRSSSSMHSFVVQGRDWFRG